VRKESFYFAIVAMILAANMFAGDVVYIIWEDDGGEFQVRIQNDTDRSIRVESILIVYYNAKGKPVDQQNIPCKGRCTLPAGDIRDFGPYRPPEGAESASVRNVKYAVE
jgi:hypothetical protein